MTKRLILIRHAKSSWSDPFADDHARVLNKRGKASAIAIGQWLAKRGYIPDLILCSDAARTQQTADLILPALSPKPRLQLSGQLYHAAPDIMLDMLHRTKGDCVAMISHNPGIGFFASGLVKNAPDHPRFVDYPTCATTVVDFDIPDWMSAQRHAGICVDFTVPRDLIGTTGQDEAPAHGRGDAI